MKPFNIIIAPDSFKESMSARQAAEAIQRGFGFIEDYPDEAVNPLESQFKVRDAEGKEVNGLKMYHVL